MKNASSQLSHFFLLSVNRKTKNRREWIKTHAICPTCRRSLHSAEGPGEAADANAEGVEEEKERIENLYKQRIKHELAAAAAPKKLEKDVSSKKVGSVTFSLPKAAVDRDSVESERKRVEIETVNRQIVTPAKETKKGHDAKEKQD